LCNTDFFAAMKPDAAFVNAGRGEQVVMPDLLAALNRGHVRGAVLDVFDTEPIAPTDPLWTHPRLVITPHMASSASDNTIARQIVSNTWLVSLGQTPASVMDREACY
jgi:glyoxylate/hydroxypyruvate reductase A